MLKMKIQKKKKKISEENRERKKNIWGIFTTKEKIC